MSHNSFVQELKNFEPNGILQFELANFMHKFHHGKLPEMHNEFFQECSPVHSYQTSLLIRIITLFIEFQAVLVKNQFRKGEFPSGIR